MTFHFSPTIILLKTRSILLISPAFKDIGKLTSPNTFIKSSVGLKFLSPIPFSIIDTYSFIFSTIVYNSS